MEFTNYGLTETIGLRRLTLTKNLSIITSIIALIWSIMMLWLGMHLLGVFVGVAVFGFLAAYGLAITNKSLAARCVYLLTLNLSVAVTASITGRYSGVEYVQAFIIGLPLLLFSWKKERHCVIVFPLLTFLLWIALHVTNFQWFSGSNFDKEIATNIVYPASVMSTFLLIIFQMSYFVYLNALFEKELKGKTAEAVEALKAKAQFLSTMSHEIRTPLNAVVGLSYLLKDANPREDQVENIDALNYSGKTLLTLINDVLDFSKMEGKHVELESIATDLNVIARQLKKIHEPLCIKKGIDFVVDIDESIGLVNLDPARMNQVLNNLISNAIKFTDAGSVTLKVSKQSEDETTQTLKIEIIDTGIGISKADFEKIFESFSQANTNTTRLYGGTGLGLPIVKNIIKLMGSEIYLDSTENEGSNFFFNLTLSKATNDQIDEKEISAMVPFNNQTILVVEDNEINVMVAKQMLNKWNLNVEVANQGEEAIEMVKTNTYDAILMDIQMPVMNGYLASIEIRKFNKNIPIIALSASVFMEVKDKIYESGMTDFLYKPFNPAELYEKIAKYI